jgi:hypothetical protein
MLRYELDLRVDAPSPEGDALASALSEASQRLRERLYRQLGLKSHSAGWVTVDPTSERGRGTLRQLAEACRTSNAVAGAGRLLQRLDPQQAAAADWFHLITETAPDSFSLWDDYPSYKPGGLPKGHALNHTFVSAAFVEACVGAGLTGVSFLRCRNLGRKRIPPWYAALPDASLGHGLDHPWFDRRKWLRVVADDRSKRATALDTGQSSFHQRWLRDDLGADEALLGPLLELFPPRTAHASTLTGLSFVTVPRYWARAAPAADFAYVPWGEDGPNRAGKMMRFRLLMVSQRARRVLIEAGLVAQKAFAPLLSIATPEQGVVQLDELHDSIPPMYTAAELSALGREEKRVLAAEGD